MAEKVFLNDKLVDADKAIVSVTDSGLLYGAGLFETMRSYNGVVFELDAHLDRLFTSAKKLSINNPYDKKYFADAVYAVLKANELAEARLRLTVTGGPMGQAEEDRKPTVIIAATKFQPYPAEYYKKGVLVVLSPFRQNPADPLCGHKTTSYYSRIICLNMAHQKKAAEALWFTTDNRLAEGCVSNIFLVKNSVLYTPLLNTPVLPGVMRKTVCEIASKNSIQLAEKDLNIDDLLDANEVFLTNVIMEIMPVAGVEKHTVGDGKVGTMTRKLKEYFDGFVRENYGQNK
jgi:branched-chain amino acid aminotransferase